MCFLLFTFTVVGPLGLGPLLEAGVKSNRFFGRNRSGQLLPNGLENGLEPGLALARSLPSPALTAGSKFEVVTPYNFAQAASLITRVPRAK